MKVGLPVIKAKIANIAPVKAKVTSNIIPVKVKVTKVTNKIVEHKEGAEFLVSDQLGHFFSGYRKAHPYWSDKISEAKELTEETHFNTLVRWEKGSRVLKKEYLD